jgi:hypothetical protein
MERNAFLRYCREMAGDEVIDNIIWRYEGVWADVGRVCRDAAIDGIRYRYQEAAEPDEHHSVKAKWKNEAERRRWCEGPQPKTALREQGIALANMLPLKRGEEYSRPSACYACGRDTSCYMDAEVYVSICPSCHSMYYRG